MRYSEMSSGMYVVRTKELAWLRVLSGEICLVESVTSTGIRVRITCDCVPCGDYYDVSVQADDGAWYDVSELVLDANACIAPSGRDCEYPAVIAAGYRNYLQLGSKISHLSVKEAVGKICLIGEVTADGSRKFTKTGMYVVSADNAGCVIVYQGYCEHREKGEPRTLTLRVLNLNGTKRQFYPADVIVTACAEAYYEDCSRAAEYSNAIETAAMVASTEVLPGVIRGSVDGLDLEAAVG